MSLKVVFMGTPDFAVETLRVLNESHHDVVGVVTVADKPAGRGRKLKPSPVKQYAVDNDLPVLQPLKLRDEEFLAELKAWEADVFVVVAFRMLPTVVWKMPSIGTLNLHGSLLPQYRGAAPIHWAVINGETMTGCTTFMIDEEIDTGGILMKHEIAIAEDATTGIVHDLMMVEGAQLVLKTVDKLEAGDLTPMPQDANAETELKKAPKIFKEDCKIDWSQDLLTVHNFIRGLSPFPGAWTTLNDETFKIYLGKITTNQTQAESGKIRQSEKQLFVATGDGYEIELLMVQAAGKKRMETSSFVLGNDLNDQRFD
ncbi:MAG: methionyl-tRNA formyltransferase [Flavobacteriales bacterium]|nr:methionyl-tRNA formyltransferase [Flavobacteriales bacterium]